MKSHDYPNAWVFLSHSNKDFDKLVPVRNELEKRGYRPLLFFLKCLEDENEISDLIKREIDARERFILCESHNARDSKWVQKEVDYIRATGRPYEVIDLEAPGEVDGCIEKFDQRSTTYVWSTEDAIAGEVELLLSDKAFKVDRLPDAGLTRTENNDLLKGAYFVVFVTCKLSKEQASLLNRFVERFQMNAMAYRYTDVLMSSKSSAKTNILEFKLDGYADNNGFYDGWDDLSFRKKDIKKTENSNVALTIVNDLMSRDKEIYGTPNGDPKPCEQSKDKNDLLVRLQRYVHLALVLPLSVNKAAHENYLKSGWAGTIANKYFDYLDEPALIALLNLHAGVKGKCFASVYSCTDLEILTLVLEDLVNNNSSQALAANSTQVYVQGVPVSSLRHYIEHLLSINGIRI